MIKVFVMISCPDGLLIILYPVTTTVFYLSDRVKVLKAYIILSALFKKTN